MEEKDVRVYQNFHKKDLSIRIGAFWIEGKIRRKTHLHSLESQAKQKSEEVGKSD